MSRIFAGFAVIALGLALAASPALAASGGSSQRADPNFTQAEEMIRDGKFADAVPLLEQVVAKDSKNADAFNALGYSQRNLELYDEALVSYQKALNLEPSHRGANEYMGELYLQLGDLPKAEERLSVLDSACFFGCDEYYDLKEAIAEYKAKQGES